jgi:tetratricopeptide (TPR) repeat protein
VAASLRPGLSYPSQLPDRRRRARSPEGSPNGKVQVHYYWGVEPHDFVRLSGTSRDEQEPGSIFWHLLLPLPYVGEHLLAEAAPRVPEEHQGLFAPEILQAYGVAFQVLEAQLGSRLAHLFGRGEGGCRGVDLAAVGARLSLGRWLVKRKLGASVRGLGYQGPYGFSTADYGSGYGALGREEHRAWGAIHPRVEAKIAHAHFRQGTKDEGAARLSAYLSSLDKPGASEGSRHAMAALYCALARLYIARRRFAESLDAAKRAASLTREVEAVGMLAEAEMIRSTALLWLDAPDEGVKTLEEAVVLAEDSGALDALGTALLLLYLAYMVRGEFDRSREHAERGAAIAQKTGDTDLLSMHTANLGLLLFYLGDWQEAQGYLERAVQLERSTQLSLFSSLPHALLGVLYKARGAWEDASRCFSEALALAREADVKGQLPYAECRLAEMDVLRGRPTEAIARLQPRVSEMRWQYEVVLLSILAEAHADTGDAARAEKIVDLAQTRARLMHNRVDGLEASRVRAKILAMLGRREEATAMLEEALSLARSTPYPYAEAKLSCEYGVLHLREKEPARAREWLCAALEVFRRLGAKKDAERTRRALQELGRAQGQ